MAYDHALKIVPATPYFRVRNRLGDFPIFGPDFEYYAYRIYNLIVLIVKYFTSCKAGI